MNCRLLLLRLYLPGPLKRLQLLELFHRSARAFGYLSNLDYTGDRAGLRNGVKIPAGQDSTMPRSRPFHQRSQFIWTGRRSNQRLLTAYATFTSDQARSAISGGVSPEILSERLRSEAREMGRSLRQRLRLRTQRQFRIALRLIYRALGIDLRVSTTGEVLVQDCFFGKFYSAPICRLMSALDDGLVEGLSGGCRLRFSRRLTEGATCCRAVIERPEKGIR